MKRQLIAVCLLGTCLTLFLTACAPTEPTDTVTTTTTTVSQDAVPMTASPSVYLRADTDAVEIIDSGQAGKRCTVTDPAQLDALFELFGKTSGEYLGDTVKGISGGTITFCLYNQGEMIGRVWIAAYGGKYFAMDYYRERDVVGDVVRYYASRYSLTEELVDEYTEWAWQFSYHKEGETYETD